eukprot:9297601-Alexandrium_andersonii.AAC.1
MCIRDSVVDALALAGSAEQASSSAGGPPASSGPCVPGSGPGDGVESPSSPSPFIDQADWAQFVVDAMCHDWGNRVQVRPLLVTSLCSGMVTEGYVLEKLGIMAQVQLTCDLKHQTPKLMRDKTLGFQSFHHDCDLFDLLKCFEKGVPCKPYCQ